METPLEQELKLISLRDYIQDLYSSHINYGKDNRDDIQILKLLMWSLLADDMYVGKLSYKTKVKFYTFLLMLRFGGDDDDEDYYEDGEEDYYEDGEDGYYDF